MKTLIIYALLIVLSIAQNLFAQTQNGEKILLGKVEFAELRMKPYSEWFEKNYSEYEPNKEALAQTLRTSDSRLISETRIKVFWGSWCGDSKRELPKFLKVAEMLGFKEQQIELIALNNADSAYKQSPEGKELRYGIFRVPTFIFERTGKEYARLTEFPIESTERDMKKILCSEPYLPNYSSYSIIQKWLREGILADTNISPQGLCTELRRQATVYGESELNSCGYVLLSRKQVREALTIFQMNVALFPLSSNCFESLAEAYQRFGNAAKAFQMCQRAIELDPKNLQAIHRLAAISKLR